MQATPFLANEFQDIVNRTLGAMFIGFSVACCIYGILISQAFGYFRQYPMDKLIYKVLVFFLLVLETIDQAFIAFTLYYYGVEHFADPTVFVGAKMKWSLISQLTIGAISGAIVKTVFALRVWRFSERNMWITGFILLLTFGQLGMSSIFIRSYPTIPSTLPFRTSFRVHSQSVSFELVQVKWIINASLGP